MKIVIDETGHASEIEISIKCNKLNDEIIRIISAIRAVDQKLTGYLDGEIRVIQPSDVYYFESVDRKTFIYTADKVFETPLKLYMVEEMLMESNFIRASKSTILNISKIKKIFPQLNGRLDVSFDNGEHLIISRQYVPVLKEKLGM